MKELQTANYFKKIELAYKYTSINTFQIPSVKKLIFLLSIKNFLASYDYEYSNTKESSIIYLKSFFFFYLLFSKLPFISIKELHKKVKYKEGASEASDYAYTLKLSFTSVKSINDFFNFFFFEKTESFKDCTFKKELVLKSNKTLKFVLLQTWFNSEELLTMNILIKNFFEEINLKALKFSLNLCLTKSGNNLNNLDLFNNLYL